jgi:type I restriction enzyme S subunit
MFNSLKKEQTLSELVEYVSIKNDMEEIDVLTVSNVNGFVKQTEHFSNRVIASENKENYKLIKKDYFAYNPARINVGSIARNKEDIIGIVSPMYVVFKTNNKILPVFLEYFFQTYIFNSQMNSMLSGSVRKTLDFESLSKIKINLPSIADQEKIGLFLSAVDRLIFIQEKIIVQLKKYKSFLFQKIFFKNVNYQSVLFSGIFSRVSRKNVTNFQNVYTISAQMGLVPQKEFFTKDVSSEIKTNYTLIEKGEFAYNKSYSNGFPFGAFKRLDNVEKCSVSPLYLCFKINKPESSNYMLYYFESGAFNSELNKIAQEGARNHGLLNISLNDIMNTHILLPDIKSQLKIGNFFYTLDLFIRKEESKLKKFMKIKKALISKIFI